MDSATPPSDTLTDCRLLDLRQLMGLLQVSKTAVYRLIKRKVNPVPTVRVGKLRRFPLDKVRGWMNNLEH